MITPPAMPSLVAARRWLMMIVCRSHSALKEPKRCKPYLISIFPFARRPSLNRSVLAVHKPGNRVSRLTECANENDGGDVFRLLLFSAFAGASTLPCGFPMVPRARRSGPGVSILQIRAHATPRNGPGTNSQNQLPGRPRLRQQRLVIRITPAYRCPPPITVSRVPSSAGLRRKDGFNQKTWRLTSCGVVSGRHRTLDIPGRYHPGGPGTSWTAVVLSAVVNQ